MPRKNDYPEIEELKAMDLYAFQTTGLGNCLFHALSDQLHGDQSQQAEYRAATLEYMRAHATHFKSFIAVHPGGGLRRNAKRKNRSDLGKHLETAAVTADEVDAAFQRYLKVMEKGGAYGDNLEIIAFANTYKVNVRIYSEEMKQFLDVQCDDDSAEEAKTAYIAHHKWEHYSSIRNTSGPHTGPPNITFGSSSAEAKTEARTKAKDSLAKRSYAQAWMVDQIQVALPYSATREAIIEALEAYKGNMTYAVSALMPASSQSSSRSSSIEREMDSDDEIDLKPKKKADRRPSRPQPLRIGKSNKDFKTDTEDSHSSSPDPSQLSAALSKLAGDDEVDPDETEEENWHNDSPSKGSGTTTESTSASESSAASNDAAGPVVRIKLSQPRKPIEKMQPVSSSSSDQSYGGDDDDDVSKSQPSRVIAKPKSRLVSSAKRDETNTIKSVDKPQNASPGSSEKSYNGEYDADGEKKKSPKVIARPRRRLITGAERDRLNAIKARKAARRSSLSPTSANSKTSSHSPPVIDVGIKVLRI